MSETEQEVQQDSITLEAERQHVADTVIVLAKSCHSMTDLREQIAQMFAFPAATERLGAGGTRVAFPLPAKLILKCAYRCRPKASLSFDVIQQIGNLHDILKHNEVEKYYGTTDQSLVEHLIFTRRPELRDLLPKQYGWYRSTEWTPQEPGHRNRITEEDERSVFGVNVLLQERVDVMGYDAHPQHGEPHNVERLKTMERIFFGFRRKLGSMSDDCGWVEDRLVVVDTGAGLNHQPWWEMYLRAYAETDSVLDALNFALSGPRESWDHPLFG
jgi:hypothetical protein